MISNSPRSPGTTSPPLELRANPRTPDAAVAFIQPLHAGATPTFRVDLIDFHPQGGGGVGLRTATPLPLRGSRLPTSAYVSTRYPVIPAARVLRNSGT